MGTRKNYISKELQTWLKAFPADRASILKADDFDPQSTANTDIDCGGAEVWILAANIKASKSASNAKSIVLMIRFGEFKAVLTGDATFDTEKAILQRYDATWLDIDLLKIGHHGSRATSTGANWVNTLKPEYAVVSSGYENSYGHPQQDVIDRVAEKTIKIDPHSMRTVTGKKGSYRYHDFDSYDEAIYATNVIGNIVVITNGSSEIEVSTFIFEE